MITKRDRMLAEKIRDNIKIFDTFAFPDNPIEISVIEDYPELEKDGSQYHLFYSSKQEKYFIFLGGLREKLDSWLQRDSILSITEDEEISIIAAHEVRHRLQHQPGIELFSRKNISSLGSDLGLNQKKLSKKAYPFFQFNKYELDATIIQILVFRKQREKSSKENIIRQVLRIPSVSS